MIKGRAPIALPFSYACITRKRITSKKIDIDSVFTPFSHPEIWGCTNAIIKNPFAGICLNLTHQVG